MANKVTTSHTENKDAEFHLDLVAGKDGDLFIFHNKPFSQPLLWLEFDERSRMLSFVMDHGAILNFGQPVPKNLSKGLMQEQHIKVVEMDTKTGLPVSGSDYSVIHHTI